MPMPCKKLARRGFQALVARPCRGLLAGRKRSGPVPGGRGAETKLCFSHGAHQNGRTEDEPSVEKLLRLIGRAAVVHPIHGSQISILDTPEEFCSTLKEGVECAKSRLAMASLYVGTGCKGGAEAELLDSLQSAASRCRPGGLQMKVLVDALRGTRPESPGPGQPTTSVAQELASRLLRFSSGSAVQVGLWHTTALRGLAKWLLPPRLNEILGVQHIKVYAWDNTVMLSGANLSNTYFTTRQDRYLVFKSKSIADQMHALVDAVLRFSLQLGPNGELLPPQSGFHPVAAAGPYEEAFRRATGRVMVPPLCHANSATSPGSHEGTTQPDTWVAPLLQMGGMGIRQDQRCTEKLLRELGEPPWTLHPERPGPRVVLSSPYLNLPPTYSAALRRILGLGADVRLLTASPDTHGWRGAGGLASLLPFAYARLFRQAQGEVQPRSPVLPVQLRMLQYNRRGSEFHAKGVWAFASSGEALTAAGSSNLSLRSTELDLELQFVVLTQNKSLRDRLESEAERLLVHSLPPPAEGVSPQPCQEHLSRLLLPVARRWL